jgi:hypothetical protein
MKLHVMSVRLVIVLASGMVLVCTFSPFNAFILFLGQGI